MQPNPSSAQLTVEFDCLESDRFDWYEAWYPTHYVRDLDASQPMPFTLLGMDLVIWWDGSAWRALEDKCPHRLVPLSEGRVTEGLLECPYHGWAFTGEGQCDRIPQQDEAQQAHTSQRACVRSFAVTQRQGMLFVYAGNPANADRTPVPVIGPYDEKDSDWVLFDTFRDLPYDATTLLENVLDASHLPYTHHKSVGNRANAAPMQLEILESNQYGFRGTWPEGPRRGKLGRQDTTFVAPNLMWHDLTSKQFGRTITAVYATPIRRGECRLFARFPFKFSSKFPAFFISISPRWYSHMGQNGILEDDQIFLHLQERYLEEQGGGSQVSKAFYMPTKADRFVFEFRQWLNLYSLAPFAGQPLPPRQTREQLLDRYHSHTKHCTSCRTALKRVKQIRKALVAVGVLALIGYPGLTWVWGLGAAAIASGVSLICAIAWWKLAALEKRFYEGRVVPPRNLPEK